MKKISLFVLALLVLAALANIASASASPSADPGHVGLVTAYTPGDSITIMDKDGNEKTFELAADLKIVPKHRVDMLAVGAYVTVVTPNNVENGKNIVVQIVIHPQAPAGFPVPGMTETATPTALPSETATGTPTDLPTDTVTPTDTATPTVETSTSTPTDTPTPTQGVAGTPSQADAEGAITEFVNWLASFLKVVSRLLPSRILHRSRFVGTPEIVSPRN
jgi:hypothetical protein